MTIEEAQKQSFDIEKVTGGKIQDEMIISSGHAVNEQIIFAFDAEDQSVNLFIFMRPFRSFIKRFAVAWNYIFHSWPTTGQWNMFTFTKDEAERLIGFLKKIQ